MGSVQLIRSRFLLYHNRHHGFEAFAFVGVVGGRAGALTGSNDRLTASASVSGSGMMAADITRFSGLLPELSALLIALNVKLHMARPLTESANAPT
jgi:hypothetical protein